MNQPDGTLEPYLSLLRERPFVKSVSVVRTRNGMGESHADAVLRLRTPKGEHEFFLEIKRTHLTRTLVEGVLARIPPSERKRWILFAPYVGPGIAELLQQSHLQYLDAVGNCMLEIGDQYISQIEGRRPALRAPSARGIGSAGYRVLFAILARPELLNASVRSLGEAAGVGKTAVAQMVARLDEERLVGSDKEGRHLLNPRMLLDRWLAGYTGLVRPRLLLGRFATNDPDPESLEKRIEKQLGQSIRWAWGGGAAAARLTPYYRGPDTIVHVMEPISDFGRRLKAVPNGEGKLIVLGVPGPVAFESPKPGTVHPLLVYTELIAAGDARAREAAAEISNRYEVLPSK